MGIGYRHATGTTDSYLADFRFVGHRFSRDGVSFSCDVVVAKDQLDLVVVLDNERHARWPLGLLPLED